MMLVWEAPGVKNETLDTETASCSNQEVEDEDGWSLFYSSSTKMVVQVDSKKTIGTEAFARIAPACAFIADIIIVHNLFDALTSSSGHRLHFLIYDKYLRTLEKVIKAVKSTLGPQSASNLQLAEGEFMLDVDGTDLAMDMKQVIRPEFTGPLGARLFDEAVMYKSTSYRAEPVYLEFPEFKGNSRRDYWLDVYLEILRAHRFIRKYNLKGIQQFEALARAILGIFRYRVVREAFRTFSSHYKTLLCFNLAESLPGGRCDLVNSINSVLNAKQGLKLPVSVLTLHKFGLISKHWEDVDGEAFDAAVDVCIGEINPLENAELLFRLIELFNHLQVLATWQDPWKSTMFLVMTSYSIFRGWIKYILPSIFVILAVLMLWYGHIKKERLVEAFKITIPPNENAAEQLLTL
ncbi:hypothetical protein LOK49_LG07G00062 [Camellia lanceoleosa]|uniref:Uncharacterized protein n=1 Tax=Camellia lanceoleosa TaxID=1840588 RepID=A0ACC0H3U1_9ERIC|nr:hypothetical protein LOK49_LG07G00062 [Camellia lanceoleosa]